MRKPVRRIVTGGGVAVALLAVATLAGPAAEAQVLDLSYDVSTTIRVGGTDMETSVGGGTFTGTADIATGEFTGDLTLPNHRSSMTFLGLPLEIEYSATPTGPVTGTFDLDAGTLTEDIEVDVQILEISPGAGPAINLAGRDCSTVEPVSISAEGTLDSLDAIELSSDFSIGRFDGCTPIIETIVNVLVPGDDNSFSATLTAT